GDLKDRLGEVDVRVLGESSVGDVADDLGDLVDEKMLETAAAQKVEKRRVTKDAPVGLTLDVIPEFLNRAHRLRFFESGARYPGNHAVFEFDFLEQLVLEALNRPGVEVAQVDVGRAVEKFQGVQIIDIPLVLGKEMLVLETPACFGLRKGGGYRLAQAFLRRLVIGKADERETPHIDGIGNLGDMGVIVDKTEIKKRGRVIPRGF